MENICKLVLPNRYFVHPYDRYLAYNSEYHEYPNYSKVEFVTECGCNKDFRSRFYTEARWKSENLTTVINEEFLKSKYECSSTKNKPLSKTQLNYLYNKYVEEHAYMDTITSYKLWYDSYGKFLKVGDFSPSELGESDSITSLELIYKEKDKELFEKYKNISTEELDKDYYCRHDQEFKKVYKYRVEKENAKIIGKHYMYKFHLILGTILTMSSCFWVPFLVGVIKALCEPFHLMPLSTAVIAEGCLYVMAFMYFTNGILVTPVIIAGVTLWPMILKSVMFPNGEGYFAEHRYNDPLQHYENLMRDLKSGNIELKNAAAVIGSQFL